MEAGQFRAIRDVVAFGAALVTLLVLVLVLEMNIVLGGFVAIMVFLGLFFILNPKSMQQIVDSRLDTVQRRASGSSVNFRIKVSQVKNIASRVENASIRDTLLDVTELAGDIADKIDRIPNAPTYIMVRLDYAFTLCIKVVGRYLYLNSSSNPTEKRRAYPLGERIELDVLFLLEQGTREINTALQEGNKRVDITPIDKAVEALEQIVKDEGILE